MSTGIDVANDSGDDEGSPSGPSASTDGEWTTAPPRVVFKQVDFQWRKLQDPCKTQVSLKEGPCQPKYGATKRSLCVVNLQQLAVDTESGQVSILDTHDVEFRIGDRHGYYMDNRSLRPPGCSWSPPLEPLRVDVAEWVSEAALALTVGETAQFRDVSLWNCCDNSMTKCLSGMYQMSLVQARPTYDVLGDGGVILDFVQEASGGEKPRDLARITASWRVWFARNGELILSTASESEPLQQAKGIELVLDEGDLMVAMEVGLKEMTAHSHAFLRISEEWGSGPLSPKGNPCLRGAAIWVEIALGEVQNEPCPWQHENLDAAIHFALEKKQQGNACLKKGTPADLNRAVRRYEAGMETLEAFLPAGSTRKTKERKAKAPTDAKEVPQANETQIPVVMEILTALQLNAAQAEIKHGNWKEAIAFCDTVLMRDATNLKALFRRGSARAELGCFKDALEDLRAAGAADPLDVSIRRELARVDKLHRDHRAAEKKRFGGVFDRMRREEECAKEEQDGDNTNAKTGKATEEHKEESKIIEAPELSQSQKPLEKNNEASEDTDANQANTRVELPAGAEPDSTKVIRETSSPDEPVKDMQSTDKEMLQSQVDVTNSSTLPDTEKTKQLVESLCAQSSQAATPFAPHNTRVVENPPPVEYDVPSFLKRGRSKRAQN